MIDGVRAFHNFVDLAQGIEAFPVKCDDSITSAVQLQRTLKYVKTNIPGPGFSKDKFAEQFVGCGCSGACDSSTCPCLQVFGSSYAGNGNLDVDCFVGLQSKPILECGCTCSCDTEHCGNRVVQHGIRKRFCIIQTKEKGFGLMLDRDESELPKLSFACEYAGEVIGEMEARRRMKETDITGRENYLIAVHEHISQAENCIYVDPISIGNIGRFINHSCDPNLVMMLVRVNHQVPRLALFARRNIQPGEELTFDYSGRTSVNMSLDSVMKTDTDLSSGTSHHHSNNEITNCNMPSCSTQNVDESLTKKVQLSEAEVVPPEKKKKLSLKIKKTGVYLSLNSKNECLGKIQNKQHACAINKNTDKQFSRASQINTANKEEMTKSGKTLIENVMRNNLPDSRTGDAANLAPLVRRKPCFCASHNCTGFLPFDSNLLSD